MIQIAFDIDGTVFDCSDILVPAFADGIKNFAEENPLKNIKVPEHSAIVATLGMPTDLIFETLFPQLSKNDCLQINYLCVHQLAVMVKAGGGFLYDGVVDVFNELSRAGYKLVIASNGKLEYIEAILQYYNLLNLVQRPIVVLNETITSKGLILKEYIAHFSGSTIMIGDRSSDIDAAAFNSVPFIGCVYGHAGNTEISGAKYIVHNFYEIPSAIKEIIKQEKL